MVQSTDACISKERKGKKRRRRKKREVEGEGEEAVQGRQGRRGRATMRPPDLGFYYSVASEFIFFHLLRGAFASGSPLLCIIKVRKKSFMF
jgi:hypothetical protein